MYDIKLLKRILLLIVLLLQVMTVFAQNQNSLTRNPISKVVVGVTRNEPFDIIVPATGGRQQISVENVKSFKFLEDYNFFAGDEYIDNGAPVISFFIDGQLVSFTLVADTGIEEPGRPGIPLVEATSTGVTCNGVSGLIRTIPRTNRTFRRYKIVLNSTTGEEHIGTEINYINPKNSSLYVSAYIIPNRISLIKQGDQGNINGIDDPLNFLVDGRPSIDTSSNNPIVTADIEVRITPDNPVDVNPPYRLLRYGQTLIDAGFSVKELIGKSIQVRGIACGCNFEDNEVYFKSTPKPPQNGFWPTEERIYTNPLSFPFIQKSPVLVADSPRRYTSLDCNGDETELSFEFSNEQEPGFKFLITLERFDDSINDYRPFYNEFLTDLGADLKFIYPNDFRGNLNNEPPVLKAGRYRFVHQTRSDSNPNSVDIKTREERIFEIIEPSKVNYTYNVVNPNCIGGKGSIAIRAKGGFSTEIVEGFFDSPELFKQSSPELPLSNDGKFQFRIKQDDVIIRDWTSADTVANIDINFSRIENELTFNNLEEGTYQVESRLYSESLNRFCQGSPEVGIVSTFAITPSDKTLKIVGFSIGSNPTFPNATDGSVSIQVADSTGEITYQLQNVNTGDIRIIKTAQQSLNIDGLKEGVYSIKASDENCSITSVDTIELTDPEPLKIIDTNLEILINDISCFADNTGELEVKNIEGGNPLISGVYKVEWRLEGTTDALSTRLRFGNVKKGVYELRVTDNNDFSVFERIATRVIEVGEDITEIVVNEIRTNNIVCSGGSGSILINASGGEGSYRYRIGSSGNFTNLGIANADGFFEIPVNSGINSQQLFIQDNQGCIASSIPRVTILAPDEPLNLSFDPILVNNSRINNTIFGESNGEITFRLFGGHGDYTYEWTRNGSPYFPNNTEVNINFDGELTITRLPAGVYSLIATDTEGCEIALTNPIEITEPPLLTIDPITINSPINCNGETTTIETNALGGIPPYSFRWERNGQLFNTTTDPILVNTSAGNYTVTVTDSTTRATAISTVTTVVQPESVTLSLVKTDVNCFGEDSGGIRLNASGGNGTYEYSIDNRVNYIPLSNLTQNSLTNLDPGIFNIWLRDTNGCEITDFETATIIEPKEIQITAGINQEIQVRGNNTGALSATVSGGTGKLSPRWTRQGDATFEILDTFSISNLIAGKYQLTVTDDNGCILTESFEVFQPDVLEVTIIPDQEIQCFGENTAVLRAQTIGGFPIVSSPSDFTFEWFRIQGATETPILQGLGEFQISNIPAGIYRVVVTDINGDSDTDQIEVLQPEELSISLNNLERESCFNESDGLILINVSGGARDSVTGFSLPYTYQWTKEGDNDFSATTKDLQSVSAGIYNLVVTDGNNCTSNFTEEIILNSPEIIIDTVQFENLTGFETNNGSIKLQLSGGIPVLNYQWTMQEDPNFSATTKDITLLKAGTYNLVITDSTLCTKLFEQQITQPDKLIVDLHIEDPNLCYEDTTADIIATIKGGVPPYILSWFTVELITGAENLIEGENNLRLENKAVNNYRIKVVDANNNQAVSDLQVAQPEKLKVALGSVKGIQCFGESNGAINIEVTGGPRDEVTGDFLSYKYVWTKNGDTSFDRSTKNITGITPGFYTVEVIDENLCSSFLRDIEIQAIDQALSFKIDKIDNLTGFETANGAINITIAGGTSSYITKWTKEGDPSFNSNLEDLERLSAGTYILVLEDSNQCTFSREVVVNQPQRLEAGISERIPIECNGEATAIITSVVTGGVTNASVLGYNYQWFTVSELGERSLITDATNFELENAIAGSYELQIRDANGNEASDIITINQPTPIQIQASETQVSCFGRTNGAIDITVSGGTLGQNPNPSYTFEWRYNLDASFFTRTEDISNLSAGEYTVQVSDANNCMTEQTIVIGQPNALAITDTQVTPLSGFETANGAIDITVVGGTAGYNFNWEKIGDPNFNRNTKDINALNMGSYRVIITDSNNCEFESEIIEITQPELLEIAIINPTATQEIQCFGGTIPMPLLSNVTGGVEPYTYEWRNITDPTRILGNSAQSPTPLFRTGEYQLTVIDNNGNTTSDSIALLEPSQLQINNTVIQNVSCNNLRDGSIQLNVSGGTPPYTYLWNNGATTSGLVGVASGNYAVTVTDQNLCTIGQSIRVTEPAPLISLGETQRIFPSSPSVQDGIIELEIGGGTLPYNFQWFNSNGDNAGSGVSTDGNLILRGANGFNYSLTIIDTNDCEFTIDDVDDIPVLPIQVEINQVDIIQCNGEATASISSTVTGGIPFRGSLSYQYQWVNAISNQIILEGTNVPLLENIPQGSYFLRIEDARGIREVSNIITITEPSIFKFEDITPNFINCGTGRDWSIIIDVSGGKGSYTYSLNNTRVDGPEITNVISGIQNISVTDALGCTIVDTITLTPPPAIEINPTVIQPQCFDSCSGQININPIGGTPPYTINWIGNETGRAVSNLCGGNYQITVIDSKGCSISEVITIINPEETLLDLGEDVILCNDDSIILDAFLPQGINYEWTIDNTIIGSNTASINVSETGLYKVEVTTDLGCIVLAERKVDKLEPITIKLDADFTNCGLEADWSIISEVRGGQAPYFYNWNNRAITPNIENITEGTYTLSIRDQQGCEAQKEITITNPIAFDFGEVAIVQPKCFEICTGSIDFDLISGVPPFTYSWNSGETTKSISNLCKGMYVVTITDAKGCEIVNSFEITEPEELLVDLGEDITLCKDQIGTLNALSTEATSYLWTLPSGETFSGDSSIEVTEQGEYMVQILNANNCEATDRIFVDVSKAVISSEFIAASQVFVNEPFIIVNIADPIPEILEWKFPKEAIVNEIENNFVELYFEQPGTYEVGFETSIGLCSEITFKKVVVLERANIAEEILENQKSSFIESKIFPNPTVGKKFNMEVKLSEISEVSIRIFNASNNQELTARTMKGNNEYNEEFSLFNTSAGLHFIIVQSKFGSQAYKLIVD